MPLHATGVEKLIGDTLHHSNSCLLRHAQATSVAATLVVPQRCSAPYWPLLFPDGVHPAEFIKEVVVLPAWESLILPETSGSSYSGECPTQSCGPCGLIFVVPAEAEYIRMARS